MALAGAVNATADSRRAPDPPPVLADEVATAFADVAITEQGGMLLVRLRVDIATAAAVLHHVARDRRCSEADLAVRAIDGSADITLPLSSDTTDTD